MIDERHIAAWAAEHPWRLNEYVEQDLVICRAMVAIFSDPFLAGRLVWKGGTALHKLFLAPQARYSEDIADPDYLADLDNFLAPGVSFDPRSAWDNVKARIVDRI